jgi:hypothetical protein
MSSPTCNQRTNIDSTTNEAILLHLTCKTNILNATKRKLKQNNEMRRWLVKPVSGSGYQSVDGFEIEQVSSEWRKKEWAKLVAKERAYFKKVARVKIKELKE